MYKFKKIFNKKYIVTNKLRFSVFLLLISMLITFIGFNLSNSIVVYGDSSIESTYAKERKVVKGDTIWEIAKEHNPDGMDIRDMVQEIIYINNLKDTNIKEGDILKLPTIK